MCKHFSLNIKSSLIYVRINLHLSLVLCIHTYCKNIKVKLTRCHRHHTSEENQSKKSVLHFDSDHSGTQSNICYLFIWIYTLPVFASTNQHRLKFLCVIKIQLNSLGSNIFRFLGHVHFEFFKHFNWQCADILPKK